MAGSLPLLGVGGPASGGGGGGGGAVAVVVVSSELVFVTSVASGKQSVIDGGLIISET